ncbi:MAG: polymer-forming cytoskeletal protein [Chloroflexia bacterium]|nr:polymer-forming cytoskeletal protein [Chloroflexia bacterium]
MVVSNQNVSGSTPSIRAWERLVGLLHHRLVIGPAQLLQAFTHNFRNMAAQRTPTHDGIIRYISMPPRQPGYLLERSDLLFRRDNQGESFDDDVSALRDQVGSGRRDQPDDNQYPDADQTTYSPPQQSWNTIAGTPTESSYSTPAIEPPPRPAPEAGEASVIAQDTTWDGTVQSSGSLHVYGTLGGEITVEGDVYVAEGAAVSANIRAGSMTIAGTIEGTIECTGRFEVLPSGRVTADVAAPRLVVHEGAVVVGKLRMTSEATGGE